MLRWLLAAALLGAQPAEQVADIQVHGNTITSNERIIEWSGVSVGMPFTPATIADVERRLRDASAFESVEVLKRFASIEDPSRIALVIIVDEGRVAILDEMAGVPGTVRKRRGPNLMIQPILGKEDGYGFSYGVQFAVPEPLGKASRVSFPLTWGGDKRAAAEMEVPMRRGLSRLKGALAVSRREHPFFEEDVSRRGATLRAERDLTRRVRFGATAGVERVGFLGVAERYKTIGLDALVDTRVDPFLPGHAVYGRAAWGRLQFQRSPDADRREVEARGYLGVPHAGVLVVRGLHHGATAPLPPAFKPLLGGAASLRGFATGSFVADNVTAASAELRLPLNSVLSRGKLGASAFFDVGAAYDHGHSVHDQKFQRGAGGGVWLAITVFKADVYVAHGMGKDTRLHLTLSTTF